MKLTRMIWSRLRLPQYRLITLFALVGAMSVPFAYWAAREHQYHARLAAVATLLDQEGEAVGVEAVEGGSDGLDYIYYSKSDGRILKRDQAVVQAQCDSSNKDISAVVQLSTLKRLRVRDAPLTQFHELSAEFTSGLSDAEKRAIREHTAVPAPPPLGAIDASLAKIAKLPLLEELGLSGTSVSGQGLRNLAPLRTLRVLDLSATAIRDYDLVGLASQQNLEELNLAGTAVTDKGIRHLASLCSLRALSLGGTKVTGTAIEDLRCLSHLEKLDLRQSLVTDEGARYLATLASLRNLDLTHTRISDIAASRLSAMKNLSVLELGSNDIGDESLSQLVRLSKVTRLNVGATQISDAGLEMLQQMRSLQEIGLRECRGISDSGLIHLIKVRSLRAVDLLGADSVTATGIRELKRFKPGLHVDSFTEEDEERVRAFFGKR